VTSGIQACEKSLSDANAKLTACETNLTVANGKVEEAAKDLSAANERFDKCVQYSKDVKTRAAENEAEYQRLALVAGQLESERDALRVEIERENAAVARLQKQVETLNTAVVCMWPTSHSKRQLIPFNSNSMAQPAIATGTLSHLSTSYILQEGKDKELERLSTAAPVASGQQEPAKEVEVLRVALVCSPAVASTINPFGYKHRVFDFADDLVALMIQAAAEKRVVEAQTKTRDAQRTEVSPLAWAYRQQASWCAHAYWEAMVVIVQCMSSSVCKGLTLCVLVLSRHTQGPPSCDRQLTPSQPLLRHFATTIP